MKHLFPIGPTVALNAKPNAPFPVITRDLVSSTHWVADNGFDSIEYHIRDPKTEVDGPMIKDLVAETGLIVSSLGTGQAYGAEGLSITSPDPDIRKRAIRRLKDHVELSSIIGGHVIIGSMRGMVEPGKTFDEVDSLMVESMKELADYAEKYDVYYAIEAIDRFETNYLQTAQDVLDVIDRCGSDRFGVHLDSYHMNIEENDWIKPIFACGDKLLHFHVADNTRNYPGSGHIPFPLIINALQQINYTGSLTMECFPFPDCETASLRGLNYLASICDFESKK